MQHPSHEFEGKEMNPDKLWLAFENQSNFRYIPIHEVVANMDARICTTVPMFHAFTGCDTVSAFCGRGKKTAWNIWKFYLKSSRHLKSCC